MAAARTSPSSTVSRAEQARLTRQRIVDTALDLFAERGYDATSLQDIADALELTKAAVYYHFRSKVEILAAVAEPTFAAIAQVIDAAEGIRGRRARIDALIDGFVDVVLDKRSTMRVLNNDPAMHSQMKGVTDLGALQERVLRIMFGARPTLDQRLATYAIGGIVEAASLMPDVSDSEIRPVIIRAIRRLLAYQ